MEDVCAACADSTEWAGGGGGGSDKLFISELCGHRLCSACLELKVSQPAQPGLGSKSGQRLGGPRSPPQQQRKSFPCPVCGTHTTRDTWVGKDDPEDAKFEQEKLVRAKVLSIHNRGRQRFLNTPTYNDYLEMREETVFEMVYGADEDKKRSLNAALDEFEIEHQEEIVENSKKREMQDKRRVIDIVNKEGSFYEIVKQPYIGRNFGRTAGSTAPVHELQRMHPEYFAEEDQSLPKPGAGLPRPLDPNVTDYESLVKNMSSDRNAVMRASGHFRDRVGQRIYQELMGGLKLFLQ